MKNKISPVVSLIILIFNIVIVFLAPDIYSLIALLVASLVHALICKTNVFKAFKFLYFGFFLAIFTIIINYIYVPNVEDALINGLDILLMFAVILIHSYIYKVSNSTKNASYAISKIFNFLKPFGYNQNKMYTTMLVVINSSFKMSGEIKQMYFHERRMYPKKINLFKKVDIIINLISPFINKMMFRNEIATFALINKDYSLTNKSVKTYIDYKTDFKFVSYLFVFEVVFVSLTYFI